MSVVISIATDFPSNLFSSIAIAEKNRNLFANIPRTIGAARGWVAKWHKRKYTRFWQTKIKKKKNTKNEGVAYLYFFANSIDCYYWEMCTCSSCVLHGCSFSRHPLSGISSPWHFYLRVLLLISLIHINMWQHIYAARERGGGSGCPEPSLICLDQIRVEFARFLNLQFGVCTNYRLNAVEPR